jgi:FkbM family methyltransferase
MKRLVQKTLKSLGYRLVARARDPETAMDVIFDSPIDAVIDVGANRGETCIQWLKQFPTATLYAFEPLPDLAELVRARTSNDAARVKVFQIAASDTSGEVYFNVHTDHPSSSSLRAATKESAQVLPFTGKTHQITVKADTLDGALAGEPFSNALMKLDVQGHELSVLNGARKILPLVRFIKVEINLQPLYESQPSLGDITKLLMSSGFKFFGVAEQFHLQNGRPVFLDALFERLP